MEEQHKSKIVWVLFIIIVALVGLNIYQYYIANNMEEEIVAEVAVVETSATPEATVSATATSTATTDTTTDLQTYTSDEWEYSIKFPNEYFYKGGNVQKYPGQEGAQDLIISDIQNMGIQDIMSNENIHVYVTTTPSTSDLQTFVDNYNLGNNVVSEEQISLGNNEAIKKIITGDNTSHPTVFYFIKHNNFIYIIHGMNRVQSDTIDSANFQKMMQIMDTFRFTK